jgi:iron complex outermembrane recepter protein
MGVLLLAVALPLRAAVSEVPPVSGVVRAADGAPLPHAQVVVATTGRGTLTDAQGRFTLRNLPAGAHRISVSMIGYAPETIEVVVPASGEAVSVELTLRPTPLSLPGLQVTATPTGRDALAAAQATSQLSGRALERNLSNTLAKTLEVQPGIAVRYNGPAASMPVLRGLTGDRILILQDGQRAADLAGSADDHSVTIDPLTAQRVEIVRGPASLLYGTNALGGVVNVISGDILNEVPAQAQWSASLQSESAFPGGGASVRGLVPLTERWALTLRGAGRSTGDVRIGADPELGDRLANTFHRNFSGALGLGYSGGRVSGGLSFQGYGLEHGVPMPPEEDEEIVLEGRKYTGTGQLNVALGSAVFPALRLQAAATDYTHEELEDGDVEMAFGLRTQTVDALLRQTAFGPFSEGAWGMSGLFRQYVATGEEQLTAPADSRTIGAFVYQEMPLFTNGASLQLGARADHYSIASKDDPVFGAGVSRSLTAFSGSAGLTVPVMPGFSASLSAARSFRAPTVEELFSNAYHIGTASYEIGDAELRPEFSQGLDAVLRVHRAALSAEFSAYGNQIDNFIHFEERGDTTIAGATYPVLAYVQDRARFFGVEGQAEWVAVPNWVVGVRADLVRAELADGTPVPFIPAARLGGSLRWDDGTFSVGGALRHAFRQDRVGLDDETPTAAYTLLDADAGIRLIRSGRIHSVTLRGDNLTNALYRDAASRIKDFAPNPGRNVALLYRVYF